MGRLGVHVARAQSRDRARQTARRDEREVTIHVEGDSRFRSATALGVRAAAGNRGLAQHAFPAWRPSLESAIRTQVRVCHQPDVRPAAVRPGGPRGGVGAARCAGGPCHAPCALARAPPLLTLRGVTLQLLAVSETRRRAGRRVGARDAAFLIPSSRDSRQPSCWLACAFGVSLVQRAITH